MKFFVVFGRFKSLSGGNLVFINGKIVFGIVVVFLFRSKVFFFNLL